MELLSQSTIVKELEAMFRTFKRKMEKMHAMLKHNSKASYLKTLSSTTLEVASGGGGVLN